MKKYFLTTALMGTFIAPAFGADKIITSANTCTVDVLGVSDNNATAKTIATWTPVTYECAPGQYLLETETSVECTPCPIGSYCPGGTYTVESENMGATTCPTDYTSDAGSTAESECYIGCELACSANVECPAHSNKCTHSAFKTTGKQFSGETCNAYPSVCPISDFQCDVGYSKITLTTTELMAFQQLGVDSWLVCNTLNEDETDGKHGIGDTIFPDNFVNDCDILEPGQVAFVTELGSLVYQLVVNDYNPSELPGLKMVSYPECYGCITMITSEYLENANFQSGLFGDNSWVSLKYIALPDVAKQELLYSAADEFLSSGSLSSATMTALQNNFSVESLMLLQNLIQNADNLDTEQLNNIFYAISFSAMNKVETNLPWVSYGKINTDTDEIVLSNLAFSIALLVGLDAFKWDAIVPDWTLSYCANNTINIDWNPDNGGAHVQNMCYYDGAVTLPTDPVRPGYTFTGWKLVE